VEENPAPAAGQAAGQRKSAQKHPHTGRADVTVRRSGFEHFNYEFIELDVFGILIREEDRLVESRELVSVLLEPHRDRDVEELADFDEAFLKHLSELLSLRRKLNCLDSGKPV